MEPWFGPRPPQVGFGWRTYNFTPKSWEGWAVLGIYYAGLLLIAYLTLYQLGEKLMYVWFAVGVISWHLLFMWVGSQHGGHS